MSPFPLPRLLSLVAVLGLSTCARSPLNGACPNGYAQVDGACLCATDEGCPTGHSCEDGLCVCRSTACCPTGYAYSAVTQSCVCGASGCCPKDHTWLPDQNKCVCTEQACCPDGYAFDEVQRQCKCAGDACCPQGFAFDARPEKNACVCASDGCCPVDFVFDPASKDCVCAKNTCCPPNYLYVDAVRACVCSGDNCCPPGFRKDAAGQRCVCVSDASCPANNRCDPVSGGCRCLNNTGCASGTFCNDLGFCQSFAACTSNLDCPQGFFCDITQNKCLPDGSLCTLDAQCAFDSVCRANVMACTPGCRKDGDCGPKRACVNQQCTSFCRDNTYCPVNQFCNTGNGTCSPTPGRSDCRSCGSGLGGCDGSGPGGPIEGDCLTFIAEGQTASFCGMRCTSDVDCPSGFDCGSVIFSCPSGACSQDPNSTETITCTSFLVENETGEQFYCTDSTGQPHEYFRSCAPSSGFCPASESP